MRATNLLHNLGQSLWLDYITGDSARQKHTRGSQERVSRSTISSLQGGTSRRGLNG